jgi:hypothetical protein
MQIKKIKNSVYANSKKLSRQENNILDRIANSKSILTVLINLHGFAL